MRPKKYFTKKQSELLSLVYPAPIGQGMSIIEACQVLSISRASGFARLKTFKDRFPEAWEQVKAAIKINQKHRIQLHYGAEHGYSIEEAWNKNFDEYIKEKF